MNTVTVKRGELANWYDTFQQASGVAKGDTEDRQNYMKFKYWCGRNCAVIEGVINAAQKHINAMRPTPAYIEFAQARQAVAEKFAERNAKGEPMTVKGEGGLETYVFTPEGRKAGDEALEELHQHYALPIRGEEQRQKDIAAYLNEAVSFDLFTLPWSFAPERVSGTYLAMLAAMFDGTPEWNEPSDIWEPCGSSDAEQYRIRARNAPEGCDPKWSDWFSGVPSQEMGSYEYEYRRTVGKPRLPDVPMQWPEVSQKENI